MHGINWNHGKLDYSELAFIIHQHCSPTTEIFAKGIEKCNILCPTCVRMWKILMVLVVRRLQNCQKTMMLNGIAATNRIDTRRLFTVQNRRLTLWDMHFEYF